RMRSVVLDGVNHADASEDPLPSLMKLDDEGSNHASRLMALSVRLGLWSRFEPIEQLRNDYVTSLQDIIKATNPKTRADSAVSERHAQIRTTALFADGEVLRIARRLEGKITEKNAIPKSDLQES